MTQLENLQFLNKNFAKKAGTIFGDVAIFENTSIATPPVAGRDWFKIFVNGVYLENDAITSFVESGSQVILTVNTGSLGFELSSADEIYAIGKFNS